MKSIVLASLLFGVAACGGSARAAKAPAEEDDRAPPADESAPLPDAAKVVDAMRPDFRRCYVDALDYDAHLAGAVMIEVKVDATGAVTSAGAKGTPTLPQVIIDCVSKRLAQAKFAAPGGAGVLLDVPFTFKKKGP